MSASFTPAEIVQATGAAVRGSAPERFTSVSTDSRRVETGALFVALVGERFDGHAFLEQVAKAGATGAVVARGAVSAAPAGLVLFEVADTLVALGQIARLHRRRFSLPIAAITGSNGKTTTKEMIGSILATRGPALKTEGNLNNEIGVPLTLLRLAPEHVAAIIEMGMNHPGELSRLVSYAEPRCAVITMVGAAHLEGLGTVEAVADAKGEIFRGLPADGLAIANADDARVMAQARASGRRLFTFGRAEGADVQLLSFESASSGAFATITLRHAGRTWQARLAFLGPHNALNACGAFATGLSLGYSPEECIAGLEAARPWSHRLTLVPTAAGHAILDDCYNANPASMAAALETLASLAAPEHRLAILGDMLELGPTETDLHHRLGEQAAAAGLKALVCFGPRSAATWQAASTVLRDRTFHHVDINDPTPAVEFLRAHLAPGDVVLVKGSRGMKLERVVEALGGAPAGGGH